MQRQWLKGTITIVCSFDSKPLRTETKAGSHDRAQDVSTTKYGQTLAPLIQLSHHHPHTSKHHPLSPTHLLDILKFVNPSISPSPGPISSMKIQHHKNQQSMKFTIPKRGTIVQRSFNCPPQRANKKKKTTCSAALAQVARNIIEFIHIDEITKTTETKEIQLFTYIDCPNLIIHVLLYRTLLIAAG